MRIEEHSYQVQEINSVNNRRLSLEKAESVNRLERKDELILQRKSGIDRVGIYNLQQIGNRSEVMESLRLRDEVEGEKDKMAARLGKKMVKEAIKESEEVIKKGNRGKTWEKIFEEITERMDAFRNNIRTEEAAIEQNLIPSEKVSIIKKINDVIVRIEEKGTSFSFKNAGIPISLEQIRELKKELRKADIDDISLNDKYLLKEEIIDRILARKMNDLIYFKSDFDEIEYKKEHLINIDLSGFLSEKSEFAKALKQRLNGKDILEATKQDIQYAKDKVFAQILGGREELDILEKALEKVYVARKDEGNPFEILEQERKGEFLMSSIGAHDLVNAVKEKGGVKNLTGREICDIIEELRREKGIIRVEVKENEKTDETKEEISSTKKALIEFQKTLGKWLEQKVFNLKIEIEYDFMKEIQNQRQGKDLSEKQEIIQDRYGPVAQNRLHFNQLKLNINGCYRL